MFSFISGATGGIGKAFCYSLAKRKVDLFITGRSEEKLNNLKEDLVKKFNIKVLYFACDLTDEKSIYSLISFIKENGVIVDNIFNVAGVDIQKPFIDYTDKKVLFQLKVNVEATIFLTHQLLLYSMEKRRDLATPFTIKILTISSMSGVSPMPYFAIYSATKGALTSFFTSLHYEMKGENVFVSTILPGGVYTREDICRDIKGQGLWGKLSAKSPEFVAEKSIRALDRNKTIFIPGFFNRLLFHLMKIMPKKIVLSFIAKRWKKQQKDAF